MTLNMSNIKHVNTTFKNFWEDMSRHEPHYRSNLNAAAPLYISTLVTLLVSTFRALVYKLLVEFEQQLIFKLSRVHPGSLCSEQQSSRAEESLAGGRGR